MPATVVTEAQLDELTPPKGPPWRGRLLGELSIPDVWLTVAKAVAEPGGTRSGRRS